MVEELIDSIKNAELKADSDIKESVDKSREMLRLASDEARDLKKAGAKDIEAEIKKANDEGKQLAEEEYSKIMFDAHKKCKEISDTADANSDKAVDFVARGLFSKYGSR